MNRKIAETPDDLASRAVLLSMSGLDFMQAMQRGEIAGPPIARTLNFTLAEVGEGRAVFRGVPLFAHTNPMGGVHGGWYGAVLDSALGCACMTMVPKGSWYTTLEYKVNITRPIPPGMEVECIATVQHAGRTTAVAEAVMRGVADGKTYATGSTTCIIMAG
jgi:uncharacterized protein (TIGR00369 family)